jgi:hypothetical protein
VNDLPALPAGKAYQAWFTKDGATFEPSTVFTNASGGIWIAAGDSVDAYAAMGLTIEDAAGVAAPTQSPFLVIELSKTAALLP